jgi:hypothetical protein
MRRILLRTFVIIPLLLGLTACDDDPSSPTDQDEPAGTITGTVRLLGSGQAVTDATLLLVEPVSLAAVAAPSALDAAGAFTMTDVPPGDYVVFVYHDELVVFDRTASTITVVDDQTTSCDLRLTPAHLWAAGDYRIEGTVRDMNSGEPVAGAYVGDSTSASFDAFALMGGVSLPEWAVTDAAGHFSVDANLLIDEGGEAIGILPITITHADFQPRSIVGPGEPLLPQLGAPLAMPAEGETVLALDAELLPWTEVEPGALGALRGRVIFSGQPVADLSVAVSLSVTADPEVHDPDAKTPVPGRTAHTDAEGQFVITGLEPGYYRVIPGYHPDDAFTGSLLTLPQTTVAANDTVDAGSIDVVRVIRPLDPADGATVTTGTPTLSWTPLPGATYYDLSWSVDGYVVDHVLDHGLVQPSYTIEAEDAIPVGSCVRWHVMAYIVPPDRTTGDLIGQTPWTTTFCREE